MATPLLPGPPHLNSTGCVIKVSETKGRGVYASRFIPRDTTIEVSPVLFFTKDEYSLHGKHTVLDHYTFNWPDGRMALALGLGSLFNHSKHPNVSFILETDSDSIKYVTARDVQPEEELCIFYGHKLWFSPAEATAEEVISDHVDDGWGGLSNVVALDPSVIQNPYLEGDLDEVVPEEDLPFTRFKLPPEEEEPESIRTVAAWVVDIPEKRQITSLLKWLKQSKLDGPELGHLKRIRKAEDHISFVLSVQEEAPPLPPDLNLKDPYQLPVPSSSALTLPSLALKSALWPTIYTPRRKDDPKPWTRRELSWAWDAFKALIDAANEAKSDRGELPIAAHIPALSGSDAISFTGVDTRTSMKHPLRHAAMNTIRQMADYQASQSHSAALSAQADVFQGPFPMSTPDKSQNGTNYLLTDRTFFITHEPCIMCSMALLHSRVKEVVYLYPMPLTGGCGGSTCLPKLKGVNHRFDILQWRVDTPTGRFSVESLAIDPTIDA